MPQPHPRRSTIVLAVAFAALGGLLFGYDTGVISGAILFIRGSFHLSDAQVSTVVSAVLWGAVAGAAVGGWLADRFGRRAVLGVAASVFVLGAIGSALAPTLGLLVIGRVVVGMAIGVASLVAPLYIAELAPARIRGSLVSVNQLALVCGILLAYLIDYALSASGGWRWMLGLAAVPAVVLGLGTLTLPESPRWLLSHGRAEQATAVLRRLRAPGHDTDAELAALTQSLDSEAGNWRALLAPGLRPALTVGVLLALFQQVTGINTVIYFAPTIFEFAGVTSSGAAILATVGVGCLNVLFTLGAVWLLDRVGRRPLLLLSLGGMALSLAALGAVFVLPSPPGWMAAASLGAYIAFFAIGLGPVFWLLIAEIYPVHVRGLAMGVATVVNWASNLIVALTFLLLVDAIGRAPTFWGYAALSVVAFGYVWRRVPETRGRTLEEIAERWRAGGRADPPASQGPGTR